MKRWAKRLLAGAVFAFTVAALLVIAVAGTVQLLGGAR